MHTFIKVIKHESDRAFQEIAMLMAVLTVLYVILSMVGSTGINSLESYYDEVILTGFVGFNLLFSYNKGMLRHYVGLRSVENFYLLFLAAGLCGVVFLLASTLVSIFPL